MKHNVRKLLALVLALTMLVSAFALAEDGALEIGTGEPVAIEGETGNDGDTQAQEGEVEIELDDGEGTPDAALDAEGGEDIDDLDLDGAGLETFEAELAPETEAAMNAGESVQDGTSPEKAYVAENWVSLIAWISGDGGAMKKIDGEASDKPTYFKLSSTSGEMYEHMLEVPAGRFVVLDLQGSKLERSPNKPYLIKVAGSLTLTGNGTIKG